MNNSNETAGGKQQGVQGGSRQDAQGGSQQGGPGAGQMGQGSLEGSARTGVQPGATVAAGSGAGNEGGSGADAGVEGSAGQDASQAPAGQQQSVAERTRSEASRSGVLRPPVDVIEDAQGITLLADMPGVSKDNLNLRLDAQSLTIEGSLSLDGPQQMDSRYAEIRHQHYERTFALSRELDGEKATAELAHGVLKIRIPKTAHATPRKIPVNVASA